MISKQRYRRPAFASASGLSLRPRIYCMHMQAHGQPLGPHSRSVRARAPSSDSLSPALASPRASSGRANGNLLGSRLFVGITRTQRRLLLLTDLENAILYYTQKYGK